MKAHAVGTEIGQMVHGVDRVEWGPDLVTEGVTTGIAYGPETEREMVFGRRCQCIAHVWFLPNLIPTPDYR